MKKMIYTIKRKEEILDQGTYKGYNYKIISYGMHPCAYIEIPKTNKFYNKDYDDVDIVCHCGLTFGDFRNFGDGSKYYFGWDYAHVGDYSRANIFDMMPRGKKWTTEEILDEVFIAIDSLIELEKKDA